MLCCESSTTPWVLPHRIRAGSPPQSWTASYLCAPVPSTGGFKPDLFAVPSRVGPRSGAAAMALTNSRRLDLMGPLCCELSSISCQRSVLVDEEPCCRSQLQLSTSACHPVPSPLCASRVSASSFNLKAES